LVTPGADSPVTIGLNTLASGQAGSIDGTATGLTQLGTSITWHVVSATEIDGVIGANVIFTLVKGATNFTFTLLDNIDNGTGDAHTVGLSLANVFTATDTDGDKIIIDAGATLTIENDIPVNNTATLTVGAVQEDALSNANAVGNIEGVGQTTGATILASDVATLVTPGADSPVTIALNSLLSGTTGSIDGTATGLTQLGTSITWHVVSATEIDGVIGANVIFTLVKGASNFTSVKIKLAPITRSEEHTSELQSLRHIVCRLLREKKKTNT